VSSGFDEILGGILGGGGQGSGGKGGSATAMAGMAAVAAPLILKFLQGGGLQKLLSGLQPQGAGDKAQSWVSTGENKAITPQELEQAIGTEELDALAQQAGASPEETKEVLVLALPQVVDKVTPNGQVPDQAQIDDLLGQLFGQKSAE